MFTLKPSGRMPGRDLMKRLHPDEEVRYLSRRHVVVLRSEIGIWLATILFYLGTRAVVVPLIGGLVFAAGTLYLAWKGLQWWENCFIFTNQRILTTEGFFSRKILEVPFKMVIDTQYERSFLGRLLGYGDLEVNLSGQPAFHGLTRIADPDHVYAQFVLLARGGDNAPSPTIPTAEAPEISAEGAPPDSSAKTPNGKVPPQPVLQPGPARCTGCSAAQCPCATGA